MLSTPTSREEVFAIRAALREAMNAKVESGVFPYNGQWISRTDIDRKLAEKQRRARVHVFELVSLFVLFGLGSAALILLLWALCY